MKLIRLNSIKNCEYYELKSTCMQERKFNKYFNKNISGRFCKLMRLIRRIPIISKSI